MVTEHFAFEGQEESVEIPAESQIEEALVSLVFYYTE